MAQPCQTDYCRICAVSIVHNIRSVLRQIKPARRARGLDAIHDMRVASRRLRATLDAYRPACAPKPFKKVYGEVKQAADLLGTARDTDVMLQNLQQQQQHLPENERSGIQWLTSRLQSYREQQQEEIEDFFEDFQSKQFIHSAADCIPAKGANHGKS